MSTPSSPTRAGFPSAVSVLLLSSVLVVPLTVRAQSFGPATALNTNASTDIGADWDPEIVADGAGTVLSVWASGDALGATIGIDGDILFSRSTDGGATWAPPSALNSNAGSDVAGDTGPTVATDGAGTWVAAWTAFDSATLGADGDILTSRSTDGGLTWGPPIALNTNAATDSGHDRDVALITDAAGTWVAAWRSVETFGGTLGTDNDILFSRSTDGGATWSPPAILNTNAGGDSGSDFSVQLATDGGAAWVAVWSSRENLGGALGTDSDILFSRSTNGGVTWSAPAALNGYAATDLASDGVPQITTDGAGNWLAVWSNSHEGIRYARSTDAGATWTAPARLAFDGSVPQVATDASGRWVVIWIDEEYTRSPVGEDSDLYVAHSFDAGATWSPTRVLNTNATLDSSDEREPDIAFLGSGNWAAVWRSDEDVGGALGTDDDIFLSSGTVLCAPSPLPTCVEGFAKASLVVKVGAPTGGPVSETLVAKFIGSPLLVPGDFGNPTLPGGSAYGLCVYDGADALVGSLDVNRAADECEPGKSCWKQAGARFIFKDKNTRTSGFVAGSRFAVLKDAPKTKAIVKTKKGFPTGITDGLVGAGSVTMQLVTSDAACISASLANVIKSTPELFKAK